MFAAVAADCGNEVPVADRGTVSGAVELHISMDDGLTFHDVCFPVARRQHSPTQPNTVGCRRLAMFPRRR